jgi:CSLREA domain-containing protein
LFDLWGDDEMNKIFRFIVPIILACLCLGMVIYLARESSQASAAPSGIEGAILVTTLEDELNTDGDCSLREAIEAANDNTAVDACPAGDAVITDTITFSVSGMITLNDLLNVVGGGPLLIDGANTITLSGNGIVQILVNSFGADLNLKGLSLVDGYSSISGGGIFNNGKIIVNDCTLSGNNAIEGGGINNWYDMKINNSTLSGNSATTNGGGIFNLGIITITNSTFSGNTSDSWGGAIYNPGHMSIENSIFLENNSPLAGGIYNGNMLSITGSTLSGNYSTWCGGGVLNESLLIISNTTLSGNNSESGGAICNSDTMTVTNATLSGNSADSTYGGGIYTFDGNVMLVNTIVTNSPSGGDCLIHSGIFTDGGHNISSDDTCGLDPANGSMPNTDPVLGPLQDNGGPTWTHALLTGSPAIDAGDNAQCLPTDQRGVTRPQDGNGDGVSICDIGSFELEGPWVTPTVVTITGSNESIVGYVTYFTATVEPISTTLPLEYVWKASGHPPITETMGLTDTVGWAWEVPGTQVITVTASNLAGSVMDTHVITITAPLYDIYLPLVSKSIEAPLTPAPSSSLPGSMALVGLVIMGRRLGGRGEGKDRYNLL